ncbi:hypothetical protein BpHYR1_052000 [Brachionus plicatilis]|uniref:Uncharacterized protein n=1 Tax=Brachionus plicatilis TaxID=10195 RepID=A0A3M7Q2F2_BRAPC|nr:hypothetical protein BpHYR1_052000 [Brachionus plicatilis]
MCIIKLHFKCDWNNIKILCNFRLKNKNILNMYSFKKRAKKTRGLSSILKKFCFEVFLLMKSSFCWRIEVALPKWLDFSTLSEF